ncbi:hypothetical protein NM688_g7576 [Phlebia brevispora]|uniref:Uncharacterized protein n=1 Tax=Phlebia brevispora TaxID=194682 RepID=A0ACC1S3M6_9APHY|nr:hypothetical protein NM688_g7576 [Phlebia brevispora]
MHHRILPSPLASRVGSALKIKAYGGTFGLDAGHGWVRYTHINGGVYFYHAQRRIITDNNMYNPRWRHVVESAWKQWMRAYEEDGILAYVPDEADVVMFFVAYEDGTEIRQASSDSGPDLIIEQSTYRYWTHVEEYPMHLKVDHILPRAQTCFLHALTYLYNERIFESKENAIDLTDSKIERFMEIYQDLLDTYDTNPSMGPILIWFLARVIREVKRMQEGTAMQCSIRERDKGMLGYAVKRPEISFDKYRTWQLRGSGYLLGFLLFGIHNTYRMRLENARFGRSVYIGEFRATVRRFLDEWTDSNLLATVLVGANVTFLTLPDIASLARTACLASSIFSVLSIGAGLYHVWHHHTKLCVDALEAAKYVYHVEGRDGQASDLSGPLIMSFFLAVPVGAIMWAILCFLLAVAVYCVESSSPKASSAETIILLGALGIASVAAVATVCYLTMGRRRGGTQGCSSV